MHLFRKNTSPLLILTATALMLGACSGSHENNESHAQPAAKQASSHAPLCEDVMLSSDPKSLFSHALVDPEKISAATVFGDMEPSSPQEVINFELGFYTPNSHTPLTAPANLYITGIDQTYHPDNQITDYGFNFEVCSYSDGEQQHAAVRGDFAHVTQLNNTLQNLFESEMALYKAKQPSAIDCSGNGVDEPQTCSFNINKKRELLDDDNYDIVVLGGEALGEAGPLPGKNVPAGIDTNLQDLRQNNFSGNYYINPDRLGAEAGHGTGWRYAACIYEYYPQPTSEQYLAKISKLGQNRESDNAPCGVLDVDKGRQGTLGGVWATGASVDLSIPEEGGKALDDYLTNMLVLADHSLLPDSKMMLSSALDELTEYSNINHAIVIDKATAGDANWQNRTNIPFEFTGADKVYCYKGNAFGNNAMFYYLMRLEDNGETLKLKRLDEDCSNISDAKRELSIQEAALTFKR